MDVPTSQNEHLAGPLLPVIDFYRSAHSTCGSILEHSLTGKRAAAHAASHAFTVDLDTWIAVLSARKESALIRQGAREYQYALLCLTQGLYRPAFSALRLSLELSLAAVFYSAHAIRLSEWLASRLDINWRRITTANGGVFTERFAKAFAPELLTESSHYGSIAMKLYRECSEFVHGNPSATASIPSQLQFSDVLFDRWHENASSARTVVSFFLFLRYFDELSPEAQQAVEGTVRDHIGHLAQVRDAFHSDTISK